ncbi:GNAT family N-acetyltransferase [Enterococcus sp. BWR-S5]|uniref:GNAT family N-acetyltransferase n=1 Tax=Enterococcus sp. BWR-S5 TaxID=2787714 RepID=UPI001923ED97|nr:GNAT family protein [Enterococcus sp. BWR-S5]MBL1226320.1 GNAT family N-acetyltransferase [Enterococcus sp. BWR-S5]
MKTHIQLMTQETAMIIADQWTYEEPYSFYDASADEEDYQELIDPLQRDNQYYEMWKNDELFGYFVILLNNPTTVELGLGLKPELTGKGFGQSFISEIMDFTAAKFPEISKIELSVAAFNQRAIKTYLAVGFTESHHFLKKTNGGTYDFIKMEKQIK